MEENEAIATRAGAAPAERWTNVLLYLDVVALIVLTAPAIVLGAPVFGYVVGTVAWIAQRILAKTDRRWIKAREPRTQLGLNLFEAFGRIWLLAGAIVLAGVVGGRADGLTAALVIFAAYSIAFVIKVFSGPPDKRPAAQGAATRRPAR
jgi:hypothetical protein